MENLPRPAAIFAAVVTITLGIAWGLAEFEFINIDPAIFEPLLTVFGAVAVITGLFAFSQRDVDDVPQKTNRDLLIDTVRNNWIEGVLHDALRDAQIQVDIAAAPDQAGDSSRFVKYDLPIETVLKREGHIEPFERSPALLYQTFKNTDGKLLILGAPGSGKTVLLLQLAEKLLEQAAADPKFSPVPVVFNLSSWAADPKQSIETWVIDELRRNYGAGKKLAQEWVNGDTLIYLLDGLDEVAEAHRDTCLTAINAFIGMTRQVVVCSRIDGYEALSDKLKMPTAVQLQPLSKERVEAVLRQGIPNSETVEKIVSTITQDAEIWKEVNKPLFINVLVTTYVDGKPYEELSDQEIRIAYNYLRRRNQTNGSSGAKFAENQTQFRRGRIKYHIQKTIIEPYITRQLRNKSYKKASNEQINRTLAWIGHNLQQREKTVFYIEMLQRDWMPTDEQAKHLRWLFVSIFGLIYGLIFGLSLSLIVVLIVGLIVGLIYGLIVGLSDIDLEQTLTFNLQRIFHSINENKWGILGVGLMAGLSGGLSGGLSVGLSAGLSVVLSVVLIVGLIVVLIVGLIVGLRDETSLTQRSSFNQGYRETVIVGLIVGLMGGLIVGLMGGLIVGLIIGLLGGLNDAIKHTILRLALERQSLAPRRFDLFLEHVIDTRIMRRVGGSAIFIHRYILEYYADLWQREYAKDYE